MRCFWSFKRKRRRLR